MKSRVIVLKSFNLLKSFTFEMNNGLKAFAAILLMVFVFSSCKKEDVTPVASSAVNSSDMYTETGLCVQTPITHKIDGNIGGYLEALPAHYAEHPGMKYPVIIFLNGSGSVGDGSQTALQVEDNIAIPHLIQKGQFPENFTVNATTFQFIVLTPQFQWWPGPADVNDFINYAIKTYRIDTNRIYICGLSMGGGNTWDYASLYGKRIAAIVPICGDSSPTTQNAQSIAKDSIGVWAFHNNGDPTVPYTYSLNWVNDINNYHPYLKAKLTTFTATVHDAWDKACNPNYTENGQNIYEWMLSHKRTH